MAKAPLQVDNMMNYEVKSSVICAVDTLTNNKNLAGFTFLDSKLKAKQRYQVSTE